MGPFKRLCLLTFSISGLLTLAAFGLCWFGPWTEQTSKLFATNDFVFYTLQVAWCVSALGLVINFLRAIFVRNRKVIIVSKKGSDSISVTRDAVASQTTNIIQEGGMFRVRGVRVSAKKYGHVRVLAKVQPLQTVDVIAEGGRLHDELMTGIATLVGDNVDSVSLEFLRVDSYLEPGFEAVRAEGKTAPKVYEEGRAVEAPVIKPIDHGGEGVLDIAVPVGPQGAVAGINAAVKEM